MQSIFAVLARNFGRPLYRCLAIILLLATAGQAWGQSDDTDAKPTIVPRKFTSELPLAVYIQTEPNGETEPLGRTGKAVALEIPSCIAWWVEPLGDVDMDALAREVQAQSIPDLQLSGFTDNDLAKLSRTA